MGRNHMILKGLVEKLGLTQDEYKFVKYALFLLSINDSNYIWYRFQWKYGLGVFCPKLADDLIEVQNLGNGLSATEFDDKETEVLDGFKILFESLRQEVDLKVFTSVVFVIQTNQGNESEDIAGKLNKSGIVCNSNQVQVFIDKFKELFCQETACI